MNKMTVAEVREIREKQSLETIGLNTEELHDYFAKGASKIQFIIDEMRKNGKVKPKLDDEV
jgi:uncharacterized hydantoinase/oxoprolinase family protein